MIFSRPTNYYDFVMSDGEKISPWEVYSCTYRESEKQRRLSDSGVANKKHFEEIIAVKKYVLACDRYAW